MYAKMLKQIEETIVFFVTFLSLVAFPLGGGPPPGYAYATDPVTVIGTRSFRL